MSYYTPKKAGLGIPGQESWKGLPNVLCDQPIRNQLATPLKEPIEYQITALFKSSNLTFMAVGTRIVLN
ncbi:MAG: hypothetical protein WCD00_11450 [Desulfuromonadaceae bacterium]